MERYFLCGSRLFHARYAAIFSVLASEKCAETLCQFLQGEGFLVVEDFLEFREVLGEFAHMRAELVEGFGRCFLAQVVREFVRLVHGLHGIVNVFDDQIPVRHGLLLSGTDLFHL